MYIYIQYIYTYIHIYIYIKYSFSQLLWCITYNVLHIRWNLACPITVHFIFLMLPQIQNNYKITSMKKIFSVDILSLLLVRPKIFINITFDVFHCHAPEEKSPWMPHHPLQWSAVMSSHAAFMASNRDIWSCALWSTYCIYMLPNLISQMFEWLIQIVFQL